MPHTSHIRAIIVDNALEWAEQLVKKFGIRNIRSQDYSFPEHSFPGPFVLWNFRSLELSFQVPWTFPAADVRAFVSRAVPGLEQRNKQKRSPMTGGAL